jgi:hypothetical protein
MQNSYREIICRPLFLLTVIYLLWLMAVLFFFGFTPTNDGEGYIDYARQCLAEGEPYPTKNSYLSIPFIWNIGIINITELSLWLFHSVYPLLLLLCLMKALTALFLSLTTERLFGHRAAILCIILFIIYPNNWGQSTCISSEIPSTFLAVTAVYLAVCRQRLFVTGFLLAVANWFRPTAPVFLLSIIAFLLIIYKQNRWRKTALLLAGFAVFVVVVGTSTYLRTGHFVYQARSLWFSMVDECYDGAATAPHWNQPIWPKGFPRYIENHEKMDCFQFEQIWRERSIAWLKDHQTEYLKKIPGRLYYMYQNDIDNMAAFLTDKSNAENNYIMLPLRSIVSEIHSFSGAQWLALLTFLLYICLLVLAMTGIIRCFRMRQYQSLFLPLFIVVCGTLAIITIMHGETRFKDPLMPYIFMLASACNIQHHQTFKLT